jgi:NADH-quinone oxidoreductase subunit J
MDAVVFWIAAGVATGGALNVIFQPKPINSVLSLVVVLFALAVIYMQLSAEFIAALQIILYAGAIMVLFLFVVMLLNLHRDEFKDRHRPRLRSLGVLLGGAMLVEITLVIRAFSPPARSLESPSVAEDFGSVAQIGHLLFDKYLLPFELTSVMLLIAVSGALVLAGRRPNLGREEKSP